MMFSIFFIFSSCIIATSLATGPTCDVPRNDRRQCGQDGISQSECEDLDCCYQESSASSSGSAPSSSSSASSASSASSSSSASSTASSGSSGNGGSAPGSSTASSPSSATSVASRRGFCYHKEGSDSGRGDPHMMVHIQGISQPVCFDYHGSDQEVVQLFHDPTKDFTLSAEIFSKPQTTKTYFRTMEFAFGDCSLTVKYIDMRLNGETIEWTSAPTFRDCGPDVEVSVLDDNHVEIQHSSGVEFTVSRQTKTLKRGVQVHFVNIFAANSHHLSMQSQGLLGQFVSMVGHVETSRPDDTTGVLSFPGDASRNRMKVELVTRRQNLQYGHVIHNSHVQCWFVTEHAEQMLPTSNDWFTLK